ncbi:uncharacterized protein LOC144886468 [Branchiostoma floridae x Branchiostoma japonicum]
MNPKELEETKKASGRFAEVKELFEATIEHEQAENERLKRDLEKANDAAEKLAKAKDSLQCEVQQEQAENEKLKKKMEEIKTASEGFAKVKKSLQATVLLKENECARLKRELEKTRKASEACAKETKSLQATVQHEKETNASLKRELDETKKASEGSKKLKESLQSEVHREQAENARLRKVMEETKVVSEGLKNANESLQASVHREQEENSKLKMVLQETRDAAVGFAKAKESLQTEIQQEKEENTRLRKALNEAKMIRKVSGSDSKTEMREVFREELGKLELFQGANSNGIAGMRKENEALERSVSFLSDKNKRLFRELADNKNVVLEKDTLEITVKKLTLVNKRQAMKIDAAKKAYSKVLVTLQKLQEDTDSDSMTEDNKDTSSAESLEWTQDSSTFAQKPKDSQKTSSDRLAMLKEDEALEPSVGLLSDRIRNRTKERVDLKKAAEEKELLEAIVKKLTTDNKRQAK